MDYNATTPVAKRVLDAMLPYFSEKFGNASSRHHSFGWIADAAVRSAREKVAGLIGAEPQEIIFTSGATEAINLGIKGVADAYSQKGKHIIAAKTEHHAVLDTCRALEKRGFPVTYLDVDTQGRVQPEALSAALTEHTILVCIMAANNETGVLQDMATLSEIVHTHKSLLFSDTTQAVGKIPVNVHDWGIDLLTVSAHKMYGPKGSGALYVRRKNPRVTLEAQQHGGGHERGLRSGTLNVPGIVGLGEACTMAGDHIADEPRRLEQMRNRMEARIGAQPGIRINGQNAPRLPHVANLTIEGVQADSLIRKIPNLAMATGSACTSASMEASHVLQAMGLTKTQALSSLRLSLGTPTTEKEAELATDWLCEAILASRKEKNHV